MQLLDEITLTRTNLASRSLSDCNPCTRQLSITTSKTLRYIRYTLVHLQFSQPCHHLQLSLCLPPHHRTWTCYDAFIAWKDFTPVANYIAIFESHIQCIEVTLGMVQSSWCRILQALFDAIAVATSATNSTGLPPRSKIISRKHLRHTGLASK